MQCCGSILNLFDRVSEEQQELLSVVSSDGAEVVGSDRNEPTPILLNRFIDCCGHLQTQYVVKTMAQLGACISVASIVVGDIFHSEHASYICLAGAILFMIGLISQLVSNEVAEPSNRLSICYDYNCCVD